MCSSKWGVAAIDTDKRRMSTKTGSNQTKGRRVGAVSVTLDLLTCVKDSRAAAHTNTNMRDLFLSPLFTLTPAQLAPWNITPSVSTFSLLFKNNFMIHTFSLTLSCVYICYSAALLKTIQTKMPASLSLCYWRFKHHCVSHSWNQRGRLRLSEVIPSVARRVWRADVEGKLHDTRAETQRGWKSVDI